MNGIPHFMIAAAIAIALYPFVGWLSLLAFVGGWLVDFDHYLFYAAYFRKYNPFEALKYFKSDERVIPTFCFFHNIEIIFLMSIISIFSIPLMIITVSLIIHVFLDIAYDTFIAKREHERFSMILYALS